MNAVSIFDLSDLILMWSLVRLSLSLSLAGTLRRPAPRPNASSRCQRPSGSSFYTFPPSFTAISNCPRRYTKSRPKDAYFLSQNAKMQLIMKFYEKSNSQKTSRLVGGQLTRSIA
jgi:hypothetical protein